MIFDVFIENSIDLDHSSKFLVSVVETAIIDHTKVENGYFYEFTVFIPIKKQTKRYFTNRLTKKTKESMNQAKRPNPDQTTYLLPSLQAIERESNRK